MLVRWIRLMRFLPQHILQGGSEDIDIEARHGKKQDCQMYFGVSMSLFNYKEISSFKDLWLVARR